MALSHEQTETLGKIFMPYAARRAKQLLAGTGRLAHYTTAENAIKIIRSRTIWLRNARGMHDFSEVEYGYSQLRDYFQDTEKSRNFAAALDGCSANIVTDAVTLFDKWWSQIQTNTYISCFSEHVDNEDAHGRLSMWRAFGRDAAGVAIVIRMPAPYSALPLKVFLTPVAYFSRGELWASFDEVINLIDASPEYLKTIARQDIVGMV